MRPATRYRDHLDLRGLLLAISALTVFLPAPFVQCQGVPRTSLVGQVIDESTGKPVPYVNVYVAGSTLGSATDERGNFVIRGIPVGVHEVVASHIAFSAYASRIRFREGEDRTLKISLEPRAVELGEVEIISEDPTEWRKDLATFKRLFLGSTRNASFCTIRNPEVLDFPRDEAGNFLALCRAPLVLENRALGYLIEYVLDSFSFDGTYIRVSAKPRFAELEPASGEEQKFWGRNRLRAYKGSQRHFLVSLVRGQLIEEGFRVLEVEALGTTPRLDVHSIVDWESIVSPGTLTYEATVHFDNFLEIEYVHEDTETGYDLLRRGHSERQTSWIKLTGAGITVSAEGDIREPFPLMVLGYWAWERAADALPTDYAPSSEEEK